MSFSKIAADIRRKQIAQEVVGAILKKKAAVPAGSFLRSTPSLQQSRVLSPAIRTLLGGVPYQPSNEVLNTLGRAYNQAKPPVDPKAAMLEKGLSLGKGALDMLSDPVLPAYSGGWNSPEAQEFRGVISDYWGPKLKTAKNWFTSRNNGSLLRGVQSGPLTVGGKLRKLFGK